MERARSRLSEQTPEDRLVSALESALRSYRNALEQTEHVGDAKLGVTVSKGWAATQAALVEARVWQDARLNLTD